MNRKEPSDRKLIVKLPNVSFDFMFTSDLLILNDGLGSPKHKKRVSLEFPNTVVDDWGNKGTWSMVYNQGFEVRISGRSYFGFSKFEMIDNTTVKSICNETIPGWSRDSTVRNWGCFVATKIEKVAPRYHDIPVLSNPDQLVQNDHKHIAYINKIQKSWTAKAYPEHEFFTNAEMHKRQGGQK